MKHEIEVLHKLRSISRSAYSTGDISSAPWVLAQRHTGDMLHLRDLLSRLAGLHREYKLEDYIKMYIERLSEHIRTKIRIARKLIGLVYQLASVRQMETVLYTPEPLGKEQLTSDPSQRRTQSCHGYDD